MNQNEFIYLDNAATTPIDPQVLLVMQEHLSETFGNPSSIHAHGRKARSIIEKARKTVATLMHTSPSEIFFTSGGTEADNMAIYSAVETYQLQHIITSPIEHHAVLHAAENLQKQGKVTMHYVKLLHNGEIDLANLEQLLSQNSNSLVTLMHGNNEVGNILDLKKVGELCKKYKAKFHSDTVQTVGHFEYNLAEISIDYLVGAAHKFHGPKGIGFIYINADSPISPILYGGAQERNMRGGTENIYAIVGLAKALEISMENFNLEKAHILSIKKYLKEQLLANLPGISFNGNSGDLENSLYTVLNVSFPPMDQADMLLFNLDINKISVSGGSACASGSNVGSHVLTALGVSHERPSVRFSFSKYNTIAQIDEVIAILKTMIVKL